jgi:hypothetical protein
MEKCLVCKTFVGDISRRRRQFLIRGIWSNST